MEGERGPLPTSRQVSLRCGCKLWNCRKVQRETATPSSHLLREKGKATASSQPWCSTYRFSFTVVSPHPRSIQSQLEAPFTFVHLGIPTLYTFLLQPQPDRQPRETPSVLGGRHRDDDRLTTTIGRRTLVTTTSSKRWPGKSIDERQTLLGKCELRISKGGERARILPLAGAPEGRSQ